MREFLAQLVCLSPQTDAEDLTLSVPPSACPAVTLVASLMALRVAQRFLREARAAAGRSHLSAPWNAGLGSAGAGSSGGSGLGSESPACVVSEEEADRIRLQARTNYFHLFRLEERFDIDQRVLKQRFTDLQKDYHPDKFAAADQVRVRRQRCLSDAASASAAHVAVVHVRVAVSAATATAVDLLREMTTFGGHSKQRTAFHSHAPISDCVHVCGYVCVLTLSLSLFSPLLSMHFLHPTF